MTDFSQLTDSDLIESVNAWRRTRNITNNGVNAIAHKRFTKLVREGEEEIRNRATLAEDTSRLDKDNIVHYNNDTSEFAKHYVRGHKGDHTDGGPTAKHKKDSNTFHSTYSSKDTRNGFAGAGTTVYTHNKTGDKFKVDKTPNGKGFYGTDHVVTKLHEAIAGWKNAASDINKTRKNINNQNKTASLVSLKGDGTPSKMHDAVSFHDSEQKAVEAHNRITEINPNRNIKHHLYVNGKLVRTLGESTTPNSTRESLAKKYLDKAEARKNK